MLSKLCRIVCLATLLLAVGESRAQVYQWLDGEGTPHFSDRPEDVPPQYRDQLANPKDPFSDAPPLNVMPGLNGPKVPEDGASAAAPVARPQPTDLGELVKMGWGQMTPSQIALGIAVVIFLVALVCAFAAALLMVACRICRDEPLPFGRGMGISFAQLLGGGAVFGLFALALGAGAASQSGSFVANVFLSAGILRGMHSESFGKALVVSLMSLVLSTVVGFALGIVAVCAGVGTSLVGSIP